MYVAKGNLTSYGDMSFTYDAFNRLITAGGTGPDGQSFAATYAYDALGRRIRKVVNGTDTDFYYDGQQVVEERDGTGTLLRQYVWGQYVDELVQQREYAQPPFGGPYGDLYPLSDLLYRSWALTHDRECGSGSSAGPGGGGGGQGSSSGSCSPNTPFVEVYDMDAYGRTRIYNGRGPDCQWFTDDDVQTFTPLCRYIFAGREYDPETGMYYNRARYYHPDLGRFISRDPLLFDGGDANLYAYCRSNPLINMDPSGEVWSWAFAGIGAVVGAVVGAIGYGLLGWMGKGGYSWGGFWGAVAGGAFAGAIVGGLAGAATGDPTFLGAVGLGLIGGAAYGFAESPVRQLIDNHGHVSVGEWGEDIAISAAIGGVTEGAGSLLRGPLRAFGRRLGSTVTTRRIGSAFETWLGGGPAGGFRSQALDFLERAEAGTLSEEGPLGRVAAWHNRMQGRYTWGAPPGGTYRQGRSAYFRELLELERTPAQLHHWLIPQKQWGRFVPNYLKNQAWNLTGFANREAHAMVDLAIPDNSLVRWGPGFRQWMAMPRSAQASIRIIGPQSAGGFDD